jgi:hypothetical protein
VNDDDSDDGDIGDNDDDVADGDNRFKISLMSDLMY